MIESVRHSDSSISNISQSSSSNAFLKIGKIVTLALGILIIMAIPGIMAYAISAHVVGVSFKTCVIVGSVTSALWTILILAVKYYDKSRPVSNSVNSDEVLPEVIHQSNPVLLDKAGEKTPLDPTDHTTHLKVDISDSYEKTSTEPLVVYNAEEESLESAETNPEPVTKDDLDVPPLIHHSNGKKVTWSKLKRYQIRRSPAHESNLTANNFPPTVHECDTEDEMDSDNECPVAPSPCYRTIYRPQYQEVEEVHPDSGPLSTISPKRVFWSTSSIRNPEPNSDDELVDSNIS